MAATASFDHSPELGLAAVAHLSRYRGTSCEHTESDLRVFFTWSHDRQLAPLTAQRHDLDVPLRAGDSGPGFNMAQLCNLGRGTRASVRRR